MADLMRVRAICLHPSQQLCRQAPRLISSETSTHRDFSRRFKTSFLIKLPSKTYSSSMVITTVIGLLGYSRVVSMSKWLDLTILEPPATPAFPNGQRDRLEILSSASSSSTWGNPRRIQHFLIAHKSIGPAEAGPIFIKSFFSQRGRSLSQEESLISRRKLW